LQGYFGFVAFNGKIFSAAFDIFSGEIAKFELYDRSFDIYSAGMGYLAQYSLLCIL
jgi:hypothetical protein